VALGIVVDPRIESHAIENVLTLGRMRASRVETLDMFLFTYQVFSETLGSLNASRVWRGARRKEA